MLTITIEEMASSHLNQVCSESQAGARSVFCSSAQVERAGTGDGSASCDANTTDNAANCQGGSDTSSTNGREVGQPSQISNEVIELQPLMAELHSDEVKVLLHSLPVQTDELMGSSRPSTTPPSFPSCSPRCLIEGNQECTGASEGGCRDNRTVCLCSCKSCSQRLQQLECQLESLRADVKLQTALHEASRADANDRHATLLSAIGCIFAAVCPNTAHPAFYGPAQGVNGLVCTAEAISESVTDRIQLEVVAAPAVHPHPPIARTDDFTGKSVFLNHGLPGTINSRLGALSCSRKPVNLKAGTVQKASDTLGKISIDLVYDGPVPAAYETECDLSHVKQGFSSDCSVSQPSNSDQPKSAESAQAEQGNICCDSAASCAEKGGFHIVRHCQINSSVSQPSNLDQSSSSKSIQVGIEKHWV